MSSNDRWRHVVNTGKVKDYTCLHAYKSYFSSLRMNAEIMCDLNTSEKIDYFMSHYADTLVQAGQECDSRLMRRQNAKWERPSYILTWHPDCGSTIAKTFEEDSAHGEHPYTKCVTRSLWKKARKAGLQKNVNYEDCVKASVAFFDARCITVLVPKNLTKYFDRRGGDLDGFVQRYENCQVSKILPDGGISSSSVIFADEDLERQKVWELALDVISGIKDPPTAWDWEMLESLSQADPVRHSTNFTYFKRASNPNRITINDFLGAIDVKNPNFKISWDYKNPKKSGTVSYKGRPLIGNVSLSSAGMSGYFKTDDESLLCIFKEARNGEKGEIKIAMLDKQTFEELLVNLVLKIDSK